jgi:RNA polymerase sigma-70 factor (ECF subfamily)
MHVGLRTGLCGAERSGAIGRGDLAITEVQFDGMVEEHAPALYRMAYRMLGDGHDAEDVVQETFRSAWKSRQRFEQGRGARAWLAAILRRRVIDRWRRHDRVHVTGGDETPDIAVQPDNPLDDGYCDEMQHALDRLPDELRESLLLVVVGELTHQEAADLLGVPLGTVLSRVSRARTRLREYLLAVVRD